MKKGEKNQGKNYFLIFMRRLTFFRLPSLAAAVMRTVCPIPFFFARTTPELETLAHFFRELDHLSFLLDTRDGV